MFKTLMLVLLFLMVLWFASMYFLGIKSKKAPPLGLSPNGTLQPCPKSPNCICSEYPEDKGHYGRAFPMGSQNDVMPLLMEVILNSGGKIVHKDENYLRAEYISSLFRFVDDVEIRIDKENEKIHFRSSSRVGEGDLGANKKRYEKIKAQYQSLISNSKN